MCGLPSGKNIDNFNFSVPEYDPMEAYDMSIQAGSLSYPYLSKIPKSPIPVSFTFLSCTIF